MKMKLPCSLAVGIIAVLGVITSSNVSAAEVPKGNRPNIYDESLDGGKQISDALAIARKEDKLVLIQFGANWCGWCHKLHRLFDTDKEVNAELKAHYVLILVDVNKGHNADFLKKYQAERLGLPSLVVLDSTGKHLTTKNSGELEEGDHHSQEKVMAFLKQWQARG